MITLRLAAASLTGLFVTIGSASAVTVANGIAQTPQANPLVIVGGNPNWNTVINSGESKRAVGTGAFTEQWQLLVQDGAGNPGGLTTIRFDLTTDAVSNFAFSLYNADLPALANTTWTYSLPSIGDGKNKGKSNNFDLDIVLAAGRYVLVASGVGDKNGDPFYHMHIQAKYAEGVVAVPIPGAIALFGAGLGVVSAVAMRRKQAANT
jgi:hypothetical protein